jgi:hypothetical protein
VLELDVAAVRSRAQPSYERYDEDPGKKDDQDGHGMCEARREPDSS